MNTRDLENTYDVLLTLLRSAIHRNNNATEVPNFKALISEARRQTVFGLLYGLPQLHVSPAERPLLLQWLGHLPQLEATNRKLNAAVVELARTFDSHGIRYVVMKGQVCATAYPQPLLRHPGDIDIYIAPQHFDQACQLVKQLGYAFTESALHHDCFDRDDIEVELHRILQPLQWPPAAQSLRKMMADEVDNVEKWQHFTHIDGYAVAVLPPHLNMILLTAHALIHATHQGVGLRQLIDWMMMLQQAQSSLSREKLLSALQKLHLFSFYRILAAFSVEFLGMDAHKAQLDHSRPYDSKDALRAHRLFRWVIQAGNHGTQRTAFGQRGGFFTNGWTYLRLMMQFFRWAPTEYLGLPWYVLIRAFHHTPST